MPSSTDLMIWQESRQERRAREKAERRRFWLRLASFTSPVFVATIGAAVYVNQPPGRAAATEIEAPVTTLPLAPAWMAPTTTALTPQSVPTSIAPLWITPKVLVPGYDGLGKLVTDGVRGPRILPGEVGRSVIGIPFDPSSAATVIVEGTTYRVINRGTVAASNLAGITGAVPVVPVVLIVSTLPGDERSFVEAR